MVEDDLSFWLKREIDVGWRFAALGREPAVWPEVCGARGKVAWVTMEGIWVEEDIRPFWYETDALPQSRQIVEGAWIRTVGRSFLGLHHLGYVGLSHPELQGQVAWTRFYPSVSC